MAETTPGSSPGDGHETWHRAIGLDSYGLVLVLVVVLMVLPAFTPATWLWRLVVGLLVVATVLLALHTAAAPRWLFWSCVALGAVVVGTLAMGDDPGGGRLAASAVAMAVLLVVGPAAILTRIARHRAVTLRTLLGAIAVYLQIGFAYSFFYEALHRLDANAFDVASTPDRIEFTYFSFVTLATLGYGDVVPVTDAGQLLAVSETVLGQIFLVAIVARIVSLLPGRDGAPVQAPNREG